MAEIIATRSAYLELAEDRRSMQEGYRFLDEKRLVLAGALLQELERYDGAKRRLDGLYEEAVAALRGALGRHGLEGLQVYPAARCPQARIETDRRNVLGVGLLEARMHADPSVPDRPVYGSAEADQCRDLFQEVTSHAVSVAAIAGNLRRLWQEYRRTSRRARALEDVLLPEISANLRLIDTSLEEQDREEAIRVRHFQRPAQD